MHHGFPQGRWDAEGVNSKLGSDGGAKKSDSQRMGFVIHIFQ